jgi:asparagine synthase (glutamine-hydrolysing)
MCGIFGIIRNRALDERDLSSLCQLADALHHRGPDGEGFHVAGSVGIGMRRLSIIDLSGGWQPLHNEDATVALVANGEIYNFVELRRMLESRGHRFRSHSDCETIVHLYEEFGDEAVHHLRGMFAFALHDQRRRRILVARDRMGEKPLVLHRSGDGLCFASEARALIEAGITKFALDEDGVSDYFHWGYIPEPNTAIRGLKKLGAGCLLTIDLDTWDVRERRYWNLADAPPVDAPPVDTLQAEIDTIGRLIVRADVPIGIGLSSGIDSSAIAALAKRDSTQPVHAFTVGYEGSTWQDETSLARRFAERLGVPFHAVALGIQEVVDGFPKVCAERDDPLSDISGAGYRALMELTRASGVRVLLTGTGGDELFWGYGWHRQALAACIRKRRMLRGELGLSSYLRLSTPPFSVTGALTWAESGAGLLSGIAAWQRDRNTHPDRLVFWDSLPWREFAFVEHAMRRLAGPVLAKACRPADLLFSGPPLWEDLETSMTTLLCDSYLLCNGLVILDRQGMASSIEGRAPLVDYRLAELVVGLRKHSSDWGLGHKGWLKAALAPLVPSDILRLRKRGFTPPWRAWTKALFRRYGAELADGELVARGILRPEAARWLAHPFDRLGRPKHMAYPALALEQWTRMLGSAERSTVQHPMARIRARPPAAPLGAQP